jgi:hypothetical protein
LKLEGLGFWFGFFFGGVGFDGLGEKGSRFFGIMENWMFLVGFFIRWI